MMAWKESRVEFKADGEEREEEQATALLEWRARFCSIRESQGMELCIGLI